ncbi:MAG TPA: YbfB/YjiJ family MFS transporter, partial [Burkholderiales bacterium]
MRNGVGIAAAGLAALAVAMGVGRFAFTPILPMMQQDSGLSVAAGGWLASANYVGYLAGALWAGAVRVRAPSAIRAGLAAIGVSTLAMALDAGFAAWAVLRAVAGVASAWVLIHTSAWCLDRLAAHGRPVLGGIVFAGVGTGIFAAGALCAALMAAHASAAAAWLVLGAASLSVTAVLWRMFDASAEGAARAAAAYRWNWARARLVAAYGAFGFGYIIPATFIPVMAREAIPDPAAFGLAWPAFGAAAAVSTVIMAVLAGRHGIRAIWIGSQLAMALGVAAPVFWPGMAGVVFAALV